MPQPLDRRALLKSLGLGALMVPILGRPSRGAQTTKFPKRLFILVWTNGALEFWPTSYSKTDETSFTLTEVLSSLQPHQKDILLIGGLDLSVARQDGKGCPGRLHHSLPHLLTGQKAHVGASGNAERAATGNGISIDQWVADDIMARSPTPIRSLELGLFKNTPYFNMRAVSFRGPVKNGQAQLNPPDISPFRVYERLFDGNISGQGGLALERLRKARQARKSSIDFVAGELRAAGSRLGAFERQSLNQHLTSLRSVEKELDDLGRSDRVCSSPQLPDAGRVRISNPNKLPQLAKLQIDLAIAAMACDVTRVATFQMGDAGNDDMTFPFLGSDFLGKGHEYGVRSHHDIAHNAHTGSEGRRRKILVDQWFISQFAYVLGRMKQIPEGDDTMLDNSLVAIFNTGSVGLNHMMDRLPWVLGGRAGGHFRTGRYVRLGDWGQKSHDQATRLFAHNALLAEMANAVGVPTPRFGDPQFAQELPGLRG